MAWKNVQYENGKYRTSSGGGGGSSTFADLEDVDLSNLQDGQVPKYNATTGKWENANESGDTGHNYSTTEQVIGTWTDGKPLYEKVIDEVIPDGNSVSNVASFSDITVRFIVNPMFIAPNGGGYISYTWSNNTFTYAATDQGIWVQRLSAGASTWTTGVKFRCVVQYTKTTD